jgi:HAD superfamily hydrolase (TIGR01509 family)
MAKIEGILFDCDGVLVNTEGTYMQVVNDTLNNVFNYKISLEDTFNKFRGKNLLQIEAELTIEDNKFENEFAEQARAIYSKIPMGEEIAIKNIQQTLLELKNVKKAVCSNGQIASIVKKLDVSKIKDNFDILVGAGKNPKPHPEVYLKGAVGIQADIFNCLAVEDSVTGLKAAIASGAISVAYAPTQKDKEELEKLMPEFIITDIYELVELYNNLNEE